MTGRFEAGVAEGSKFCCGSIRSIQNWQYVDVRGTRQTGGWINTAAATFNLAGTGSLGLDSDGSWDTRQVLVLHVSVKTRRWMREGPRCRSSVWYLHTHTCGLGDHPDVYGHFKPPFCNLLFQHGYQHDSCHGDNDVGGSTCIGNSGLFQESHRLFLDRIYRRPRDDARFPRPRSAATVFWGSSGEILLPHTLFIYFFV